MINRKHALPIKRQAELADIRTGNVHNLKQGMRQADQQLIRRIDAIDLEYPVANSHMRGVPAAAWQGPD